MLLTGVDASFDFDFNDYLHSASLCAAPRHRATLSKRSAPDLFHFRDGNFLTSSVIIVSSVSANSLRAHSQVSKECPFVLQEQVVAFVQSVAFG
jgi:hypothetical protein